MSSPDSRSTTASTAKHPWRLLLLAAVVVLVLVVLQKLFGPQIESGVVRFTGWVESLGPWAPAAFIAGYVTFTVALVPGSILTMAGGALFGLLHGTLYVTLAAVTGATCAFLIARHLARERFEKRLEGSEKLQAIDRAIAREGGKIVLLLRLSPVFPFTYLNYALGLTRVRLVDYIWASVGMIPGTFLYVYYGKTLGDIASIAAGTAPERGMEQWISLGAGLLATVLVTAYITRLARKALAEVTDD